MKLFRISFDIRLSLSKFVYILLKIIYLNYSFIILFIEWMETHNKSYSYEKGDHFKKLIQFILVL